MNLPLPLHDLAACHLGPATAAALGGEDTEIAFQRALEQRADEIDALLALAFPIAQTDQAVAGEFLQYFMILLRATPEAVPGYDLRHIVDPEDLVQSVAGNLLQVLTELEFRSRGQFLSLLVQRLNWKRVDKVRREKEAERVGDWSRGAVERGAEASRQGRPDPLTPLSAMIRAEREGLLVLAMNKLSEADQEILRAGMRGETLAGLAKRLGCSADAARKRAERARDRLRERLRAHDPTRRREGDDGER